MNNVDWILNWKILSYHEDILRIYISTKNGGNNKFSWIFHFYSSEFTAQKMKDKFWKLEKTSYKILFDFWKETFLHP